MEPNTAILIGLSIWGITCVLVAWFQIASAKRIEWSFNRLIQVVTGAETIKQSRPPKPPEPPKAPIPKKTGKRLTIQHSI